MFAGRRKRPGRTSVSAQSSPEEMVRVTVSFWEQVRARLRARGGARTWPGRRAQAEATNEDTDQRWAPATVLPAVMRPWPVCGKNPLRSRCPQSR
jgi:hypothetical protein